MGQNWLRLNYDSGAAVTALPIAIAGDLPLEKCGEFRVASGAVMRTNYQKMEMQWVCFRDQCTDFVQQVQTG